MRHTQRSGSFLLCLLINLVLNIEGIIPAIILLVLHYTLDWSIWFFWAALGLWLLGIVFYMFMIGWFNKCGNDVEPPKENKNPYSSGKYSPKK